MKRKRRAAPRVVAPVFEQSGHLICQRAVHHAFGLCGSVGIWICRHSDETKVTFGFTENTSDAEVQAAYVMASEKQREIELTARAL